MLDITLQKVCQKKDWTAMGTGEDSQEQRESSDGSSAEDSFKNLMDLKECLQDSPNFR